MPLRIIKDAIDVVFRRRLVRGKLLESKRSRCDLLQHLLGLPEPVYQHHRLIRDEAGHKLSKSSGSTGLRELRASGAGAADIRGLLDLR